MLRRSSMVFALALVGAGGVLAALALAPGHVHAGNTVHPRTPVLWPDAPCIQTLDRSVDSTFTFTYAIPAEDTQLSLDEFEDSRRHQFVGFCRQWPAGRPPPRYISVADLERSVDAGHEQPELLDDPEAALETSQVWADCWTRITADDDRRPITHASAAEPVGWDTQAIAAGTWLVAGYTWEPPYNLWSRAPWVLRVLDDPQPLDLPAQAAATIANTDDALYGDEILDLPVCVDAEPGSTLTLEWAPSKPETLEWTALDAVELDGPTELSVPFAPPAETLGLTVVLRTRIEQPTGAAYDAHALDSVIVFAGGDADTGDGDPGDGDGDGGEDDGTGTGETGDGESGTGEVDDSAGDEDGGRCSVAAARGNLLPLVAGLGLLLLARRRRRDSSRRSVLSR